MRIVILSDDRPSPTLPGEHGLSMYMETGDVRFLLDTGDSDRYLTSARAMGIDLSRVDFCVLSHAHHDHTSGIFSFLRINPSAPVYVSYAFGENKYHRHGLFYTYNGPPRGLKEAAGDRLKFVDYLYQTPDLGKSVWLLPTLDPGYPDKGKREKMYQKIYGRFSYDTFCHEMTVCVRETDGLVVLNSCSHTGVSAILESVHRAFPDTPVKAYIGGLHLSNKTEKEIRKTAESLREGGIGALYTGHCTGERAYAILKEILPRAALFRTGDEILL